MRTRGGRRRWVDVRPIFLNVLLVTLLPAGGALATELCRFVDPGTPFVPVAVDPESSGFQAFNDAYRGDGTAWRESSIVNRFDVTSNAGDDTLPPGEIKQRLVALVAALSSSPAFASDDAAPPDNRRLLREAMVAHLENLARAVAELESQTLVDWAALRDAGGALVVFNQSATVSTLCASGQFSTSSAFFASPNPGEMIVLRVEPMTPTGPLGVPVVNLDEAVYIATVDQAVVYRTIEDQVDVLFAAHQAPSINHAALRLGEINVGWSNYLEKGFSQYPWEALLNSWAVPFTWDAPPSMQIILVHPEIAAVVDARSSQSGTLAGALLIHGLGYVHYFGAERGWFLGLSGTGSVTTESGVGWGGGGTLHFGHSAIHSRVPHISVSVLYQDTQTGQNGPFIGISADLWRLFDRGGAEGLFKRMLP